MSTVNPLVDTPLPDFDPARIIELDVRELLRSGGEPRSQIVAAADALPQGHVLHIRSTFRPDPLLRLMHQRGFHCHTAEFGESDWSTWFWRSAPPPSAARAASGSGVDRDGAEDYRLLPPPEPLLRILARIGTETAAFDVLLPFYPEPLIHLLHDEQWSLTLVDEASDGVRVRIAPLAPPAP
ncbi:MAG: DUF2249 domain-containing protein [Gemmatimonadota bacterium]